VAQDLRWNVFFIQQIKQNDFKWLLNGMQNTLPSEQNLALWKYKTGSSCVLCGEQQPSSLIHVLNCCTVALKQGRYTMRHDSVLACLEPALRRQLDAINTKSIRIPDGKIRFVKEGAAPRKELSNSSFRPSPPSDPFTRLLGRHRDWQLLVDLAGSPSSYSVMPPQIAAFSGRPDLIVYSESGKVVLFAELTIPSPTGISAAERRKLLRYKDLAQACQPGWKCFLRTVEVSSLGFLGVNMHMFLKSMFLLSAPDRNTQVGRCSGDVRHQKPSGRSKQHWTAAVVKYILIADDGKGYDERHGEQSRYSDAMTATSSRSRDFHVVQPGIEV